MSIIRLAMVLISAALLSVSCMSYQKGMSEFNRMIAANNFEEASEWLEKKKVFKKSRNAVLVNLEKASIERIKGNLEQSNAFLQDADFLIEDRRVNVAQRAMSLINNPLSLPYQTEFFEDIAVHYYKCLNFLSQSNYSKARVEARRANIALNRLNDAVPDKPLKYHDDVLAHTIMGLAYELNKETNNAFIAYRNAVDLFIQDGKQRTYMGTSIPKQLIADMFRTGELLGFNAELSYYRRVLNVNPQDVKTKNGELILFWENGQAPQKQELIIDFNLEKENGGGLTMINEGEGIYTSLSSSEVNRYNYDITDDHVALALPIYKRRLYPINRGSIRVNGKEHRFELLENLDHIAPQSLKDRYLRELGNAILRVLAKRAIQESLSSIVLNPSDKEEKKEEDKKEELSNNQEKEKKTPISNPEKEKEDNEESEIDLGQVFNVVSSLSERADIRSWQSLPAQISYVRIPLKSGMNQVEMSFYDKGNKRVLISRLNVKGDGKTHVKNIITPANSIVNQP